MAGAGDLVTALWPLADDAMRDWMFALYAAHRVDDRDLAMAAPSLVSIYHRPPHFGNALVLGISQSGRSPDIVARNNFV